MSTWPPPPSTPPSGGAGMPGHPGPGPLGQPAGNPGQTPMYIPPPTGATGPPPSPPRFPPTYPPPQYPPPGQPPDHRPPVPPATPGSTPVFPGQATYGGYGGYGPPFGAGGDGYRPPRGRSRLLASLVVAVALLGGIIGLVAANSHPGPPIASHNGGVVFTDTFGDPGSGWSTIALPSGTRAEYRSSGLVITSYKYEHHFWRAPYPTPQSAVGMTARATIDGSSPSGSGVGVACEQETSARLVRYQFLVENNSHWYIEKDDTSDLSITPTAEVLHSGRLSFQPGTTTFEVEGVCITKGGSSATRLVLFVNGTQISDVSDDDSNVTGSWRAMLETASPDGSSASVTVSVYTVRIPTV